jgi:hypothetical protein
MSARGPVRAIDPYVYAVTESSATLEPGGGRDLGRLRRRQRGPGALCAIDPVCCTARADYSETGTVRRGAHGPLVKRLLKQGQGHGMCRNVKSQRTSRRERDVYTADKAGDHDPGRCLIKAGIGGENGS